MLYSHVSRIQDNIMLQITGEILTASVIANLVTIALAIFVALIKSVEAPVVTKQMRVYM